MNIRNKISLVSLMILGVACGAKPTTWAVHQSIRNYSVGLKEFAGNQLYLNDSVDSIGADGSADAAAVTPEVAAAQDKLATARASLALADKVLADAQAASADSLAVAQASTKIALDLAKAAKTDASLKAQAATADTKARADGALVDVANAAERKALAAQVFAADLVAQAEKVVIAQGGDINGGVATGNANDALAKAQADLLSAQDALTEAKALSLQAQSDAKAAKDEAKLAAKAALADATLQAQADAALAASDAAALKAAAAADAEALAAAEVAKADAAVVAAGGVAGEVAGDAGAGTVDPVTEGDVQPKRIGQMVAQLFVTLDVNANDTLDLAEFLKITEVKHGPGSNGELNADQLAALEAKLTAKFAEFAGADNVMTDVELSAFLKANKNRVGKMRKRQGQAGNSTSSRCLSAEQLLAKFDVNKDGVIDLTELTAMKAAISPSKKGR